MASKPIHAQADTDLVEIVVCLGSSCFARGNAENLAILKNYVQRPGSNTSLRLTGSLCEDRCKDGPNLMIAGKLHHCVTAARLRELLEQRDGPCGGHHGTT